MAYSDPKVTIDLAHYNELVDKCNKQLEKPAEVNKFKGALEVVAGFIDVELKDAQLRGRMKTVSEHFDQIMKQHDIQIVFNKTNNGLEITAK